MQTTNTVRRMDGQTNKMFIVYKTITFSRSCNVNPSEKRKQHTVLDVCQNRRPWNSISILGIPVTFSRHKENATFALFMKKAMHLKTGYLLDYQVLFLLLNGLQIEKKGCSVIDRFMTSEGSDMLILPLTSKTGQSVAQTDKRFLFGFYQ